MSIFCNPAAKAEEPSPYPALVYDLARKAEAETLPKSRPLYLDMMAAHKLDAESYSFECKRWGDFLALFIARGGKNYAGAINLGETREIKLVEGSAPSMNGSVWYFLDYESDEKPTGNDRYFSNAGYSSANGLDLTKPPPKGFHFAVRGELPSVRKTEAMIYVAAPPTSQTNVIYGSSPNSFSIGSDGAYYRLSGNYFGLKTLGVAKNAEDDRIEFNGISTILIIPAGQGTKVRDAILAEIARGFKPK